MEETRTLQDLTGDALRSAVEVAERLERIADDGGTLEDRDYFAGDGYGVDADTAELIHESYLDAWAIVEHRPGSAATPRTVVWLIGCGGPHQELRFTEDGWCEVSGRWDSSERTQDVYTPELAAIAWELVDYLEAVTS